MAGQKLKLQAGKTANISQTNQTELQQIFNEPILQISLIVSVQNLTCARCLLSFCYPTAEPYPPRRLVAAKLVRAKTEALAKAGER
jgi:hypothetical protein